MNRTHILEEIKNIIDLHKKHLCSVSIHQNKYFTEGQLEYIYSKTSFLDENTASFSERLYCIYYDIREKQLCQECNKNNRTYKSFIRGYSLLCQDKECLTKLHQSDAYLNKRREASFKKYGVAHPMQTEEVKNKIKSTCMQKYDVDNPMKDSEIREKVENTCIERYGVKTPFESEVLMEKRKNTWIENYGVDHPWKSDEIRSKVKKTCLEYYGVENPNQSEEIQEKIKETCFKKYGVDNPAQSAEVKEKLSNKKKFSFYESLFSTLRLENKVKPLFTLEEYLHSNGVSQSFKFKCNKCGSEFSENMDDGTIPRCLKCYPEFSSLAEQEVIEYIQILGVKNIQKHNRSLIKIPNTTIPLELDLYLSDYKLAIEYNGVYYHNSNNKAKEYHKLKFDLCTKAGIDLISIWEDQWKDSLKQNIIKSLLSNKLNKNTTKIYARDCLVKELDSSTYKEFLLVNHLQGYAPAKIKFGLFYKENLVSIMSFSKPRFNKKYEYEMVRFCNKVFTNVVGGASKLFTYFTRNLSPKSVVSYSLNDISSGKVYNVLNFDYVGETKPNYFYVKNKIRYSRETFQKHKLIKLLQNYNDALSEKENMLLNNYNLIYDSGNKIYEWCKDLKGEINGK